ncbi:MAG: response regulator [Agriterribacter sp.]
MKLTLKRNLLIGFSISLLILLLSSAASLRSISILLNSAEWVRHTNEVVRTLEKTQSAVRDAEDNQRGYLLTGNPLFLKEYKASVDTVTALTKDFEMLTGDNPEQQANIIVLSQVIDKRLSRLEEVLEMRKKQVAVDSADMEKGKIYMDSVQLIVKKMTAVENNLLKKRTAELSRFSNFTPIFIMVAALLAIIITIVFYVRMNKDISARASLQEELINKDNSIRERIRVIQSLSEKISSGDYSVRVTDTEMDELGNISVALNKMAASLEQSFNALSEKEWLQSGMAKLSETMMGENDVTALSGKILHFCAGYSDSKVGAFYIKHNQKLLLAEGYALENNMVKQTINAGEGIVGECARSKQMILTDDLSAQEFHINYTTGQVKPVSVVVLPVLFEGEVKAVIELGALHQYTALELDFFKRVSESTGIAVDMVQSRQRMQELLEETQSQAEELMTQQSELEQINLNLETKAQQLQSSEEELKVQSEELAQTNALLEERSAFLQERNQLILQKNEEIKKRSEELSLATRYKSEFLANMSHELRTPLNSILLLSRLLAENHDNNLNSEQVQSATVIQQSGNSLLQLIDEILDLSKIESGKMTIELLPVKVQDVTTGMQVLFDPVAVEKKLRWNILVQPEVPAVFETDRLRLEQILKNLLSNAFKFTTEGGVKLTVSCLPDKPGFIFFAVKDTGTGINPEKLELIFEAFRQEDGSTRRKFGGTGLGLSISRELARLLGGEITVISEPGKGSEFICSIPLSPENRISNANPLYASAGQSASKPHILQPSEEIYRSPVIPDDIDDDRNTIAESDKIILIIEDDITFARALLDYTRQKDYKAIVAVRGDAGIQLARQYLPAAILLDVQLPVKSGWEVMESLKADPLTMHIPVHVMSAHSVKKESLIKGAVHFINKPVAFEQLNNIFEKIDYVLEQKEKKVLILEENYKHAKALAYYLGTYNVQSEIFQSVEDCIQALGQSDTQCVIFDISAESKDADRLMEEIKERDEFKELPIILFTSAGLSQLTEFKMKQYADAIVMKTANSYKRILDEISLFLHLVQEKNNKNPNQFEQHIQQENKLKGKKVLLADDDVRNIFSMTKALEKYQMEVVPAMDGKEALKLIQDAPVDVVLMDMMMPEMDGYESIRAIRQNPRFKNIPILAITAKAMTGDREKCIEAGASDYISKPVDVDQLVSLLRVWLYEKRY